MRSSTPWTRDCSIRFARRKSDERLRIGNLLILPSVLAEGGSTGLPYAFRIAGVHYVTSFAYCFLFGGGERCDGRADELSPPH